VRYQVVVTDGEFLSFEAERKILDEVGAELVVHQARDDPDRIREICRDADGILVQYGPLTRAAIRDLERCKIIVSYGIGYDSIDVQAATERGIPVANVPRFCVEEVSDHAIMLLLAVGKKLAFQNQAVKTGRSPWDYHPIQPVHRVQGRTLGIVGFGKIGRRVAVKAQGLGMRVLACDPYIPHAEAEPYGVPLLPLEEVLQTADYVSFHVPLTEETYHLLDADRMQILKPSCCIVNTSRGKVVDQRALAAAIREGRLAGAGLDVLENEPPKEEDYKELLQLDQVTVTPHLAWYSEEAMADLQVQAAEAVAAVFRGEWPDNIVNLGSHQQIGSGALPKGKEVMTS
jgi:D-3-phosphoglycerate dehydrogenase